MPLTSAHPGSGRGSRARPFAGVLLATAVLAVTVLGAFASGPFGGRPVLVAESISSALTNFLQREGMRLPLGYAFVAGMIAAVNPCGFALLPAYLGLYLGQLGGVTASRGVVRALWISLTVAGTFVLLFGSVGLITRLAASALAGMFPWFGLAVGVVLVVTAAVLLTGGSIEVGAAGRLADRLGATAGRSGMGGYAAFGLAYGIASLGCTLPLFLGLLGTAFAVGGFISGVVEFMLFALGMGFLLAVVTVTAAMFGVGALRRIRRVRPYVARVGAALMLLAGAYLVFYWLAAGGLLRRIAG
jgi:cytochrome c-type biogenesis protein